MFGVGLDGSGFGEDWDQGAGQEDQPRNGDGVKGSPSKFLKEVPPAFVEEGVRGRTGWAGAVRRWETFDGFWLPFILITGTSPTWLAPCRNRYRTAF